MESGTGSIWILLTTHVTCIEDISQKREFIYLRVYLNNGRKMLFPCENIVSLISYNTELIQKFYFTDGPFISDKRINNQHFLFKLSLDPTQTKQYIAVDFLVFNVRCN